MPTGKARTPKTLECRSPKSSAILRAHPSRVHRAGMSTASAIRVSATALLGALALASCQPRVSMDRTQSERIVLSPAVSSWRTPAGGDAGGPQAPDGADAAVFEADGGANGHATVSCVARAPGEPDCLYFGHEQTPPSKFQPLSRGPVTAFPSAAFTTVVAVAYHRDGLELDTLVPGCEHKVLAPNGTFCPSVSFPGATLSPVQVERLLAAMANRNDETAGLSLRCEFDPQLAFVFLNADRTPVAEVDVDIGCGRWSALPRPRRLQSIMGSSEKEVLALCRELDLPLAPVRANPGESRARGPWPREHSSGVDVAQTLNSTSPVERRRLCGWSALRFASMRGRPPPYPITCRDGKPKYWISSVRSCVNTFPVCDTPVGAVEECIRHLEGDTCFESRETIVACAGLERCIWGVSWLAR